jgi:hypothetical protein
MKKHERKPQQIDEVTEKVEYNSTLNVTALKNMIVGDINEYQRKLELGREIKEIVQEMKAPTLGLRREHAEALELFENRGHVKEIKPIEWRPWQIELLKYVDSPTSRRIIWVVGKKGNEGKTFFQNQIEEQYGCHRVCAMSLTESPRNLLHYMRSCVDITTDIFLFNIPKSAEMDQEKMGLLEHMKDGKAMAGKYTTKRMRFKTPNVIMVFSNNYPDTSDFSEDRWNIFRINKEMLLEDVTVSQLKKRKKNTGAMNKYSGYRNNYAQYYDSD